MSLTPLVQVESPQLRKATPAGRSKSFSNHRPLDPEVIGHVELTAQVRLFPALELGSFHPLCLLTSCLPAALQDTQDSALSELSKFERQTPSKHTHTPDVVLDTLEQLKGMSGGGGASEPSSPLHSRLLRDSEGGPSYIHPLQRSASSASDVPSSFRPPKTQPRSPLPSATSPSLSSSTLSSSVPSFREVRPPVTRPKPVVFPKGGGTGSPAMGSPTSIVPPTPPPPLVGHTHSLAHTPPPPPPPPQSTDKSCPA